jgi:hypothetical protein
MDFPGMAIQDVIQSLQWNLHLKHVATRGDSRLAVDHEPSVLLACSSSSLTNLPPVTLRAHGESVNSVLRRAALLAGLQYEVTPHWALIAPRIRADNLVIAPEGTTTRDLLQGIQIRQVEWREASVEDVLRFLKEPGIQSETSKPFTNIVLGGTQADIRLSLSGRDLTLLELLRVMTRISPLRISVEQDLVRVTIISPGTESSR